MENEAVAYQRPGTMEMRVRLRGCRTCIFFDSPTSQCRRDNVAVSAGHWCGAWQFHLNPRVNWTSAFAGIELKMATPGEQIPPDPTPCDEALSVLETAEPESQQPPASISPTPPTDYVYEYGEAKPAGEAFWELI